jgi:hypothetical protein
MKLYPNAYIVDDLRIEFLKDFRKEYNQIQINKSYNFGPLLNTSDTYQPTEFSRKDPVTYIRIKGTDLWLYEKNQQLYFDKIEPDLFYKYRQPYVIWIEYLGKNVFILYKLLGYGLNNIMGHIYDRNSNVVYMNYMQQDDKINITWVDDFRFATRFVYDTLTWNDFGWIRLYDKETQAYLLGRHL